MTTASSSEQLLTDWVEQETRALDVVASWEPLCSCYRALEFSDEISDSKRIEEFKWIIAEMNKFLTRMRKKLMSCANSDAMMKVLGESFTPSGTTKLNDRQTVTYQKLRQQWITNMMAQIELLKEETDGEPSSSGEW